MRIFKDFVNFDQKHPWPADAAAMSGDLDLQVGRPLTYDPDVHRDLHHQLKSSLEVFQPRRWRPLTPDLIPQTAFTRCRPVSGRSQSQCHLTSLASNHKHAAHSDLPTSRPDSRVGSAKLLHKRPDTPRVNHGNFDTLSPAVLSQLVSDSRPLTPESTYGSVSRRSRSSKSGGKARRYARSLGRSDSDSSSYDADSDDEWVNLLAGSDDESLSDMEKGNEPSLDPNRPIPDLHLRPELLDREYVPRRKSDMRRFDFSAENIDLPVYCFKNPVPSPLDKINIRYCALQKLDWKMSPFAIGSIDPAVCSLMDRLVEIEKIQAKTARWETQRVRHVRRGKSVTTKARSKRCCAPCLQPACVGDCPHKRVHADCCVNCRQPLCTGSCTDTRYDQRMRQTKDEGDLSLTPINPSIARMCKTCQGRNNAVAAQEIAQGRPRSAMTTFSRMQASTKGHTARPTSAEGVPEGLPITVSKMKLEPRVQIQMCRPKKLRPHSRQGLIPGKSISSNLNQSLTDLSAIPKKTREPRKLRKSVS
ncbi:unnamed protein product [Lymnaea stagnalis]|uniref:Uncharacterized protein n=1 Tax=Lymnaea stagnalis TaxID=6523 RepID=A0AAV2HR04_LYMST